MQVGIGRAEISFTDDFYPMEGFVIQYSPLCARVVLFRDNIDFAILSVEMTSLPASDIADLQELVSRATGVDKQHCWVCTTHTFSAPHILPDRAMRSDIDRCKRQQLRQALAAAVNSAAQQAVSSIAGVELSYGTSLCAVNVNREVETPDGWWVGSGGEGPVDRSLHLIAASDMQGKPLALLYHYSVQPSVMDGSQLSQGGKIACADLTGVASARLEQDYPDAVAMFIMGAAGDQAPVRKAVADIDLHEHGWDICGELGSQLADAVRQAYAAASPITNPTLDWQQCSFAVPAQQMPDSIHNIHPTHSYAFNPVGTCDTTIEVLRLGDIAILGVRPELNCVTAMRISDDSPFATTLVATMVNGGAKYMADSESYDRITYQSMNSRFASGAAEQLEEQAAQLLGNIFWLTQIPPRRSCMKPSLSFPHPTTPELDPQQVSNVGQLYTNIAYCDCSPDQAMDIYIPQTGTAPYPLVIYIHEGAFAFGSKRDERLRTVLPALNMGWAVASVDYRKSDIVTWPAQIYDVKAAVRCLRASADQWKLDPSRFVAWGASAGGYLASMLGTTAHIKAFEDLSMGNADSSSMVQGVIDWFGCCGGFDLMDGEITANANGRANHNDYNSPESIMMGSALNTIPELCRLAAPYLHVHCGMPPFLIQHGDSDSVTPIQQSLRFAEAIRSVAGDDRVQLITYAADHNVSSLYDLSQAQQDALNFLRRIDTR